MLIHRTWVFETALPGDLESAFAASRQTLHTVELAHNYWTTRRTILLDGLQLGAADLHSYSIYGKGSDDLFFVDSTVCLIQARPYGLSYRYEFALNGYSLTSGKPVQPWPETWQAWSQTAVPPWAWFLVVTTLVLPAAVYGWVLQFIDRPDYR